MTDLEKAIQYVRENKTWSDAEEIVALETIDHMRCSLDYASPSICDEIHDLMEEWSEDNEMPEGWWYEEADEHDVFFML